MQYSSIRRPKNVKWQKIIAHSGLYYEIWLKEISRVSQPKPCKGKVVVLMMLTSGLNLKSFLCDGSEWLCATFQIYHLCKLEKKKKMKSEREKTLNTFSTRNGTPHFTNVRRIITVTEHRIMVFSNHTRELFLLRVWDSEPSTSGILSSFGITNLTYSLSSLPSPPLLAWFFSNCSVESGILLIYQMSA